MIINHDIRHIRAFLTLARTANFTRAAAELNVSQPALTVQIRQLEESLGVRLFDRNKRQVVPTRAGRELAAPLQRVLSELERVMDAAHDLASLRRGVVSVATLPSVAAGLLPVVLRAFRAQHPGIRVQVADVVAQRIVRLVRDEEADFGIGPRIRTDPDVEITDLLTDRMCVFCPDGHPLAERDAVTLAEAAAYPLVLTARDSSVRLLLERALEAEGLEPVPACEANYMSTAMGMVRAGLGISILPEAAADAASCAGVRAVALRGPELERKIGIIRRKGRSLSPAAERFVEAVQAVAAGPHPHFALST